MTHTPEPWQQKHDYNLEGAVRIIANVDADIDHTGTHYTYDTVAICHDDFDETLPNAESNARRIVACVNALSGISTEAIEAGGVQELVSVAREAQYIVSQYRSFLETITSAEFDLHPYIPSVEDADEKLLAELSKWEASK